MTKTILKLCLALAVTGLAGCKVVSHTSMFVSDIVDAMEDPSKPMYVATDYRFEVSSSTACQANVGKSHEILARYFADVEDVKCARDGIRDFVQFSTKSPMIFGQKANGSALPGNLVAGYGVTKLPEEKLALYTLLHRQRVDVMMSEFKQVFRAPGTVNIELYGVSVTLQNDLNGPIEIGGPASFINDEPQLVTSAKIDRRGKLKFTLTLRRRRSRGTAWHSCSFSRPIDGYAAQAAPSVTLVSPNFNY